MKNAKATKAQKATKTKATTPKAKATEKKPSFDIEKAIEEVLEIRKGKDFKSAFEKASLKKQLEFDVQENAFNVAIKKMREAQNEVIKEAGKILSLASKILGK